MVYQLYEDFFDCPVVSLPLMYPAIASKYEQTIVIAAMSPFAVGSNIATDAKT